MNHYLSLRNRIRKDIGVVYNQMAVKNIIQAILTLPQNFNAAGNNRSLCELLGETGYFEFHDQLHEDAIAAVLISNRDRIIEWAQWCEEKKEFWRLVLHCFR
jgi:hypothetical protein